MLDKAQIQARIRASSNDFHIRLGLVRLLIVISQDFKGHVSSENKLSAAMKAKYGWGNKTTRKRLDTLQTLGIVTMNRTGKNQWTKEYRLCEA